MTKITNDLEQPIMDCWSVMANIKAVIEDISKSELSPAQVKIVLEGLSLLYESKFNSLFNMYYEEVLKENHNG